MFVDAAYRFGGTLLVQAPKVKLVEDAKAMFPAQ